MYWIVDSFLEPIQHILCLGIYCVFHLAIDNNTVRITYGIWMIRATSLIAYSCRIFFMRLRFHMLRPFLQDTVEDKTGYEKLTRSLQRI